MVLLCLLLCWMTLYTVWRNQGNHPHCFSACIPPTTKSGGIRNFLYSVIDAYRIEAAAPELQAMMSAAYIAGYRIGMLVAGAGALFLAGYFGTEMGHYRYQAWRWTYAIMAATMLIGVTTTLLIAEPARRHSDAAEHSTREYVRFVLLFVLAASSFIGVFFFSADAIGRLQSAWSGSGGHEHAVQYAIFSSLMTLFPKLLGGYSGSMVEAVGYAGFFILTTLLGLPVLVLVWRAGQRLELKTG